MSSVENIHRPYREGHLLCGRRWELIRLPKITWGGNEPLSKTKPSILNQGKQDDSKAPRDR